MKLFQRPRAVLGFIYFLFIGYLVLGIYRQYVQPNPSTFANTQEKRIVLGISILDSEARPGVSAASVASPSQPNGGQASNWSTSFALQSQSPTAQVYLDYIAIYNDGNIPDEVRFDSIQLLKNDTAPLEMPSEMKLDTSSMGRLENGSDKYIFHFDKPLVLEKGRKYVIPHVFLGFVSENAFSNLLVASVNGYRSFSFFPFDEQVIPMNFSVHGQIGADPSLQPSLEATVAQEGWVGSFSSMPNREADLHLRRPSFYKWILSMFFLLMLVIIPLLNSVVDELGSYFEVAFGLLLGLWGAHQILIPSYVTTSIPIDFVIYILYILVIGGILVTIADALILNREKHRLLIGEFKTGALRSEFVEIENKSIFPINMTNWQIFDQDGNTFKFPRYTLRGRRYLFGKPGSVRVWTKRGKNDEQNLYWGRKEEVWDNDQDVAHLEDAKGEPIFIHRYVSEDPAKSNGNRSNGRRHS